MGTALVGLLSLSMLQSTAQAQDTKPQNAKTEAQDAPIIVTGIRASLKSSRDTKRKTDAVVDVITAQDVGKFPDKNVAESLAHLTGVAVDRNFGEGEKVSIHGTDPALNRIFVDGHSIATANWGGDPNDISGRTFNYNLLAPELIGQARVFKSPEAWIDEGSLGGTVLLDTRKPLSLPANTLNGSLGYAYNDRSQIGNGRGSLLYSWKDKDDKFGIMAAVTYNREDLKQSGIEMFSYNNGAGVGMPTTINGQAPTAASTAAYNSAVVPGSIDHDDVEQERERKGFSLTAQWRPEDNLEFTLSGLHILGNYTNFNQAEYVYGGTPVNMNVVNGVASSGNYTAATGELDNDLRKTHVNTDSLNLAGKWTIDDWKISGNIGTTKATGGKDPEYVTSFYYNGPYSYAFTKDSTMLNYDGANPANPNMFMVNNSNLNGGSASSVNGVSGNYTYIGGKYYEVYTDKESYGQIDVERPVDFGPFNKIMFGLKSSNHDNSTWSDGSNIYINNLTTPITLSNWQSRLTPSNIYAGLNVSGNATPYATLTPQAIVSFLNSGIYENTGINYGADFDVNEIVNDAYFQSNFKQDQFHGNMGVRLAHTEDKSTYWLQNSDGTNSFTQTNTSYTKLLPDLNMVYDYSDHIMFKGGIAGVMARPRYSDLAGSISVDDTTHTGGGGNPNLKPYLSTNYEGSFEYYFGKSGIFATEVFFRDISSYIIQGQQSTQTLLNQRDGKMESFAISSPFNAANAKVRGIDFQYNTELPYNFGLSTNVTYADADTGNSQYNMPYLSKYTLNVIPYYENGPWQIRLSTNYRTKYFTSIGRVGMKQYTAAYTEVGLSSSYEVNKHVSVYLNASNLMDQIYYQYDGVTQSPIGQYKNGRVISVGVNYKM